VSGIGDESVIFNVLTLDLDDIRATFKGANSRRLIDILARQFAKPDAGHGSG
jgi:hypothetical protein